MRIVEKVVRSIELEKVGAVAAVAALAVAVAVLLLS